MSSASSVCSSPVRLANLSRTDEADDGKLPEQGANGSLVVGAGNHTRHYA